MKASFREYHTYSENEMKDIWKIALVVVDTNVILDFYSFGEKTLEDYYGVLEAIKSKDNLWMPYQVGYEFYENRVRIISKQLKQYEKVLNFVDQAHDKILALDSPGTAHSHLDFKALADQFGSKVKLFKSRIERLKDKHPDYLADDAIVKKLEEIYSNNIVGQEYNDKRLEEIYKQGEVRYKKKIPPGYKDDKKGDGDLSDRRRYGDLIIWRQIIDKAKEVEKPIIFVTNDAKEDWIKYSADKRKLGAKSALRKELLNEAGVDFFLFSSDEFLEAAHKQFNLKVEASSVREVKKYREIENARVHSRSSMRESGHSRYHSFHSRLHRCISLANNLNERLDKEVMPLRARDTIRQIVSQYDTVHAVYRHSSDMARIIEDLDGIDLLLLRLLNILRQIDESAVEVVEELTYRNRSLKHSIDRDHYGEALLY